MRPVRADGNKTGFAHGDKSVRPAGRAKGDAA